MRVLTFVEDNVARKRECEGERKRQQRGMAVTGDKGHEQKGVFALCAK